MKMTSGMTATGNIVASTPKEFFNRLSSVFNFTLDVCALPENAKCNDYYTPDDDGLSNPWRGGYGVTRPMEERYPHGSRKVTRNPGKTTTTLFSCCFLQGQIQSGGGIGCREKHIFSSSKEG